jgi:hypothetical protein
MISLLCIVGAVERVAGAGAGGVVVLGAAGSNAAGWLASPLQLAPEAPVAPVGWSEERNDHAVSAAALRSKNMTHARQWPNGQGAPAWLLARSVPRPKAGKSG